MHTRAPAEYSRGDCTSTFQVRETLALRRSWFTEGRCQQAPWCVSCQAVYPTRGLAERWLHPQMMLLLRGLPNCSAKNGRVDCDAPQEVQLNHEGSTMGSLAATMTTRCILGGTRGKDRNVRDGDRLTDRCRQVGASQVAPFPDPATQASPYLSRAAGNRFCPGRERTA